MISVVLYGRNDAHGYNLHRRAALSLNCLAEVLTDPEDELIFVDYNTPDELPTFVEALADTLTDRCVDRLRVLRVPAAVHRERYAARTHLPALEPVARNAGVRRANSANRWVLSTNTDMILLPHRTRGLADVCEQLGDGAYGLPRFELPEWLWERLPRSDPDYAMTTLRGLGPRLHLDEPTTSDDWIRFDAPGDFQLVLRDDFVAIDGFDEDMILGWHVDSNLSRRLVLLRGGIESLEDQMAGYHCNHSRTPTVYHGSASIGNDLHRFYSSVEHPELPHQRTTWGLADLQLEEVPLRSRASLALAEELVRTLPEPRGPRVPSRAIDAVIGLTYDTNHVFPFVADSLAVSAPGAVIGYVGANRQMEALLRNLVTNLGHRLVAAVDDSSLRPIETATVIVFDFGLDASVSAEPQPIDALGIAALPPALRSVLRAFQKLVETERQRLARGAHPRRLVLIHSAHIYTDGFVVTELDCSHSSTHSRVRRATVRREAPPTTTSPTAGKRVEQALQATTTSRTAGKRVEQALQARRRAERMVLWTERLDHPAGRLRMRSGSPIDLGRLSDFHGFGGGWGTPDDDAIWTRGPRAELAVTLDARLHRPRVLSLWVGRVGVRRGETLTVALVANGRRLATRRFEGGTRRRRWNVRLPDRLVAERDLDILLEVTARPPRYPDRRELGLHVYSLGVRRAGLRRALEDLGADATEVRARISAKARPLLRRSGSSSRFRVSLGPRRTVRS